MGSQVSPTTLRLWFWLKRISRRDLRLAQPHIRFWFWLKEIGRRDLRLAQPHTLILVLVKGDRQKGSQVSPTTHIDFGSG